MPNGRPDAVLATGLPVPAVSRPGTDPAPSTGAATEPAAVPAEDSEPTDDRPSRRLDDDDDEDDQTDSRDRFLLDEMMRAE